MRLSVVISSCVLGAFATACSSSGSTPPAEFTTTQTVSVGQAHNVRVLAGRATTTIAVPADTSGTGTLTFVGASPSADVSFAPGGEAPIVIPGTPIAVITLTPSAAATYGELPFFSFTFPSGTIAAGSAFTLYIADPEAGSTLQAVAAYVPTVGSGPITLTTAPLYVPVSTGITLTPILPITYSAANRVSFILFADPASS